MSVFAETYVVVVGCGRMGSRLANGLSRRGESVTVIDRRPEAFANLDSEFSGFRVEGDATELAVLRQAKADRAAVVIAATREDNVNLMIVQIALKVFGVKRSLARVFDPRREEAYRELGVETVCPTRVAADLFLAALDRPSGAGAVR